MTSCDLQVIRLYASPRIRHQVFTLHALRFTIFTIPEFAFLYTFEYFIKDKRYLDLN